LAEASEVHTKSMQTKYVSRIVLRLSIPICKMGRIKVTLCVSGEIENTWKKLAQRRPLIKLAPSCPSPPVATFTRQI